MWYFSLNEPQSMWWNYRPQKTIIYSKTIRLQLELLNIKYLLILILDVPGDKFVTIFAGKCKQRERVKYKSTSHGEKE